VQFIILNVTSRDVIRLVVTSRDHWTPHVSFSIGGPLQPYAYLAPLWRYGASKILGSRPWPFGVTWRDRSRDHSTPHAEFPIGGHWWLCIYLAPLVRFTASNISGYDLDLLRSRDVMVHVTVGLGICGFLLVVLCNHASILHRYGDMEPQRLLGHDLDLLGSRAIIGHVTIRLPIWGFPFPLGGQWWPCLYLAPLVRYKASK